MDGGRGCVGCGCELRGFESDSKESGGAPLGWGNGGSMNGCAGVYRGGVIDAPIF